MARRIDIIHNNTVEVATRPWPWLLEGAKKGRKDGPGRRGGLVRIDWLCDEPGRLSACLTDGLAIGDLIIRNDTHSH